MYFEYKIKTPICVNIFYPVSASPGSNLLKKCHVGPFWAVKSKL